MSCNEWESGTIKLPTDQVVFVRTAVRSEVEKYAAKVYDLSQEFWKGLKHSEQSFELYQNAVNDFCYLNTKTFNGFDNHALYEMLGRLLGWQCWDYRTSKGRRALQADVTALLGKPTGAKFRITLGEASIGFDGRTITWNVPENNHACDRAHEHPFARVLFTTLNRVRWTRGSGGTISGNNEYTRDSRDAGGGANYVVMEFGPAGRGRAYNR